MRESIETLSIPKEVIDILYFEVNSMMSNGEYLPKKPVAKLALILHLFKKVEKVGESPIEQPISHGVRQIITSTTDRKYLIDILVRIGLLQKTSNYRVGCWGIQYIYLGANGFYTLKDELELEINKLIAKSYKNKKKNDSKYYYMNGVKINADGLISRDYEIAIKNEDSNELNTLKNNRKLIDEINNGIFNIYKKETMESRLYSNITAVRSEYRKTMTFKDKSLVEVDMRSCHPMILVNILEDFAQNRQYQYMEMSAKGKNVSNMAIWNIESLRLEISSYLEIIDSGIYGNVAEFANLEEEIVKVDILKFLNDPNGKFSVPYVYNWFELQFPIMLDIINYLHSKERKGKSKIDGKNRRTKESYRSALCFMCMRKEQEIVLQNVVLKFRNNNPENFIATVHDAIIVESEKAEEIESLICERFMEIGINCQTKKVFYSNYDSARVCGHTRSTDSEQNVETLDESQSVHLPIETIESLRESKTLLPLLSSHSLLEKMVGDTNNDTKIIDESNVRQVDDHGSSAWMYRGTGNQQMKKSCKKYTKEQFIELVNEKFRSIEWK